MGTLKSVMDMADPQERTASVLATVSRFTDILAGWVITDVCTIEEATRFFDLTYQRAVAMLAGDADKAAAIEAEGTQLQAAIKLRQETRSQAGN